jgi:hypothetical protein
VSGEETAGSGGLPWGRLGDLLAASLDNNEAVLAYLDQAVPAAQREEPQFIRGLVTAVVESCIGTQLLFINLSTRLQICPLI